MSSVARRRLGKLGFVIFASQLRTQIVDLALKLSILLLSIGTGLNRRALTCALALCGSALELGAQLGKLSVALGNLLCQLLLRGVLLLDKLSVALRLCLLQGSRRTRALKLQRLLALALDCLHTLIQVARKLGIAHLLDDVRIARRIDLKNFATMRALDLVHSSSSMDANFNRLHSTAPHGQKRRRRHNGNSARTTTKVPVLCGGSRITVQRSSRSGLGLRACTRWRRGPHRSDKWGARDRGCARWCGLPCCGYARAA